MCQNLAARIRSAVAGVVEKEADCGVDIVNVDIVNDGEMSKPSDATYVKDRRLGSGGESHPLTYQDLVDFPDLAIRVFGDPGRAKRRTPGCTGPVSLGDAAAVTADIDNLRAALARVNAREGFISTASPSRLSLFFQNGHYPTHES